MKDFRFIFSLMLVLTLAITSPLTHAEEGPLKLGIFPYVSPGQLVKFHTDLKVMLEQTLGKKVVLVTAPSFKEFIKRTQAGNYDIIMTAPHLGRLAEVRDGYRPLVHTMHEVQGIYLAKKSSGIKELKDLENKTLTLVGRRAIITQMVERQLNALGLQDGKNISFIFTKTHNNAMYAPLRDESDASVTGILLWRKIGQEQGKQVNVIGKTPTVIGFLIMTKSGFPDQAHEKLQKALLGFHNTSAGKKYMEKTGFRYLDLVDEKEKQALDPYIQIFLKK